MDKEYLWRANSVNASWGRSLAFVERGRGDEATPATGRVVQGSRGLDRVYG